MSRPNPARNRLHLPVAQRTPLIPAIREEIKKVLKQPGYDDGSAGPVFVRLAWHASGTFSLVEHNGGSNGAGMRFEPESVDPANAGLTHAINFLLPIQAANPWISHADLWSECRLQLPSPKPR